MKKIVCLVVIIICISGVFFRGNAQRDIMGGDVSGTWSSAESPFRIFDNIIIPDDSTLNIEPGVRVEFQGNYRLNVQGRLLAIGTKEDTIVFTVKDTTGFSDPSSNSGGWNGIRFIDTPSENDSSTIEYCKLMYGKAISSVWHENTGGAICIVHFNKVRISHCLITNNIAGGSEVPAGGAIHLAWSGIQINDNRIQFNLADAGGAVHMHESDPVFSNNTIIYNKAREGGGISIGSASNPVFDGDSILFNEASEHGGGLMCWSNTNILFNEVIVKGNKASWGAGLGLSGVEAHINNCYIQGNISSGLGGGIGADFCTLVVNDSRIMDNSASMSGGIHSWYTTLKISDSEISQNFADFGGGIHADFSQLDFTDCDVTGNQASNGGGMHIWNSNLTLDSCQFVMNHALSEGGAIELNFADTLVFGVPYLIKLSECRFHQNSADFRSGTVRIEQYENDTSMAEIVIDRCVFFENHAERISGLRISGNLKDFRLTNTIFHKNQTDLWNGGASFSGGCTGKVINCEFSNNKAKSGNPGGSGVSGGAFVHFINCTFTNNSAGMTGGLSVHRDGKASVTNCIFWGNEKQQISVRGIQEPDFSELYVNYCNIRYGQDSIEVDSLAALHWGEGNIAADPLFVDVEGADYRLLDESPCIDSGIDSIEISGIWYPAPMTDIEGNSRLKSGKISPDMGAYENQSVIGLPDNYENQVLRMKTYPNPFDRMLTVEFIIKKTEWIELKIFDLSGNEVDLLIRKRLEPGKHIIFWSTEKLNKGLYICQLKTMNTRVTKKLVLRQ